MRLTRLRLNGFKSFVDPTDLLIADGLTGVVGPNGCGKSNLLEALRWVMGENRPTAMRGDGMEDVIFAGSGSRPARNFAEVALVIDNGDRLAPAGFNDQDSLEIVRRITRDAGSAYKVNTRDVRARDVQMLFADASTGAHSPALVRQGQIAELINARPKNRRRILEEAAGISGLYQRRHEAELKLSGAETNLARVDDVVEQMAAQIASLARQARAAAKYREIGADLRRAEGMLLWRRWQEADAARASAEAGLLAATRAAAQAEAQARAAETLRTSAEERLPPLREEEAIAAAVLQRLVLERDRLAAEEARAAERIEALTRTLAQIEADATREEALSRDAGEMLARLDWEATELRKAQEGHEARLEAATGAAREAASVLADREDALSRLNEDVARLSARHQSAQRLEDDSRKALARAEAEALRAREAGEAARAALERAAQDQSAAEGEATQAARTAEAAEETLAAADAARAEAQSREADARAARSEAEGEASALRAEVGALHKLVERDTAEGGQVIDRVEVARGYEAALGAALADDLRAPEIAAGRASGWARLDPYAAPQPLPGGARPLTEVVKVPEVLARRMSQIGVVAAADGERLQAALLPGQRLVSEAGDLWRWDGFRAAAADAPSAAALRLRQLNRLTDLKRDLTEAEARADGARQAHEHLAARLKALTEADARAREARRDADRNLTEANRRLSRAEADRSIAAGKLEAAELAQRRHEDEATEARARLREAEAAVAALEDLTEARAQIEDVKLTVEAARVTMLSRRAAEGEVRREGEARVRRGQEIVQEASGWKHRLATAADRKADLAARAEKAAAERAEAAGLPGELAARRERLACEIDTAETRRKAAADRLAEGETALREAGQAARDAERGAGEAREGRARAEALAEAARAGAAAAAERIAEDLDCTPQALLGQLQADPAAMPDAHALEAEVLRLRRAREALGAVNLRAEEDMAEVEAEHGTLVSEKADLEAAIAKLRAGIASLNREGRERLLTAFEQVNANFTLLFRHLFGGGEARLTLVESDDPLEAGLEILCQPPGKKLSTLSLLSGGEQTLTALALIFGVFLVNPAPICVLDEVDAPLDDANVTRFCDLLDEMCRRTETRFLIITHHAVTMSRMDRLFGVTMQEQGVSQLVSVDLRRAAQMVA